jgi:predicted nucleotidyltransferase
MPNLDPALEPVLTALVQRLRELDIPFCIIGALVPALLLDTVPDLRTNDADAVVTVSDLAAFETVKRGLAFNGFAGTADPHRLAYRDGKRVDLLPYSRELAPGGTLRLSPDRVLNMLGFEHVVEAAIWVTLDSGLEVPVVPLPLYALLKLVAYTDRRARKDLDAVEHVLRHYADDDDRRWGLEHEEKLVDYDYGPAYLLGMDGARFIELDLIATIQPLIVSLSDGSRGSPGPQSGDDEWRPRREDLFLWYRRGLGL